MKQLFAFFLLIIFSCNMNNTIPFDTIKQNPNDIHAIKAILASQQIYWNNGDIEGFMQGYWKSEELIFTSHIHKPVYGWKNTLESYKNSYPTKSSMGELNFEILYLKLVSETTAILKGRWELIRKEDNPTGLFWLDIEKLDNDWVIKKDSTISY